jgi:glycosylphosphatidylinositol transamidase (GPIT) subunit GPI8
MYKRKIYFLLFFLLGILVSVSNAQTDYTNLNNWAFLLSKSGILTDGFHLDTAAIDENL